MSANAEIEERDLELSDEDQVEDEAEGDETVPPVGYQIVSYGADYDVEGLVRRLRSGDIFVPRFQRSYVWKQSEASRFIESLLLGLPVPGVFLAREEDSGKFLVLDGQQRLKTLQFFYEGEFNPAPDDTITRRFTLTKVQSFLEGKTYKTLDDRERRRLDNAIIHATIVKQEIPAGEDSSIYHIFERLNSRGRFLTAQEIRCSIYHGSFMQELKALNENRAWRDIFGRKNTRLKDEELILRFLALYFEGSEYRKPMAEFLNGFSKRHRKADQPFLEECRRLFTRTIDVLLNSVGLRVFHLERALNAAVFDSVMVGMASEIQRERIIQPERVEAAYNALLADTDYQRAVSRATSDEGSVTLRLRKAREQFATA